MLSDKDQQELLQLVNDNKDQTLNEIATIFNEGRKVPVSLRTVQRILRKHRIKKPSARRPPKKKGLTNKHLHIEAKQLIVKLRQDGFRWSEVSRLVDKPVSTCISVFNKFKTKNTVESEENRKLSGNDQLELVQLVKSNENQTLVEITAIFNTGREAPISVRTVNRVLRKHGVRHTQHRKNITNPHLDTPTKQLIIKLRQDGFKYSEIARIVKKPESTCCTIYKNFQSGKSVEGRQSKLIKMPPQDQQDLVNLVESHPNQTLSEITNIFNSNRKEPICVRTVQRILRKYGVRAQRKRKSAERNGNDLADMDDDDVEEAAASACLQTMQLMIPGLDQVPTPVKKKKVNQSNKRVSIKDPSLFKFLLLVFLS
jgi:transposase